MSCTSIIRSQFKCFLNERFPIFFENAGGSQVPIYVPEAICDYMTNKYAQLGAGYEISSLADETIASAREFLTTFFNAHGCGNVIIGNSTTQLLANIANTYAKIFTEDDEIIIQESSHESNIGPYINLSKATKSKILWWKINPVTFSFELDDLKLILSAKTKLVALTHVSNLLGEILNLQEVVPLIRECCGDANTRCKIIVDGVAYAPHLPIDVKSFGVDWYVFSLYKTWGPHMAALYGSNSSFEELTDNHAGLNHYFIADDAVPYKFELGGVNHEGCAAIVALKKYFQLLAFLIQNNSSNGELALQDVQHLSSQIEFNRDTLEAAYSIIRSLEIPLQITLLDYLSSKPGVIIIGKSCSNPSIRVPTISFIHEHIPSSMIAKAFHMKGFALRNGHMYAHRLVTALQKNFANLSTDEGVVRLSLLHYNTSEEVAKFILAFDEILSEHI